ncbi:MAG: hypothetical protein ACI4U5_02925 [Bacilli bacterium]
MKTVIKILIGFVVTILVIVGLAAGALFFVGYKYDIDVVKTIKIVTKFAKPVKEEEYLTNPYDIKDMDNAMNKINDSVNNLVTIDVDGQYVLSSEVSTLFTKDITLLDKEVAAIMKYMFLDNQSLYGEYEEEVKDYIKIDICEFNIDDVTSTSASFETKFAINIDGIKKQIPSSLFFIKNKIPSNIYYSLTTKVNKVGTGFNYTNELEGVTINTLSSDETQYVFSVINKFVDSADFSFEELTSSIGEAVVNGVLGNETNKGLGYVFGQLGATSFSFTTSSSCGAIVYSL